MMHSLQYKFSTNKLCKNFMTMLGRFETDWHIPNRG